MTKGTNESMTKAYDPHGIDRLIAAILANAVEDASGQPVGAEHKTRLDREPGEYNRIRLATNAIDWLLTHGAEWLEYMDIDARPLEAWLIRQEANLFGDTEDRAVSIPSTVSPAPVESNAIRPGRPATNRTGSLWARRLDWVGRNGKVYRCTIPNYRRTLTRS